MDACKLLVGVLRLRRNGHSLSAKLPIPLVLGHIAVNGIPNITLRGIEPFTQRDHISAVVPRHCLRALDLLRREGHIDLSFALALNHTVNSGAVLEHLQIRLCNLRISPSRRIDESGDQIRVAVVVVHVAQLEVLLDAVALPRAVNVLISVRLCIIEERAPLLRRDRQLCGTHRILNVEIDRKHLSAAPGIVCSVRFMLRKVIPHAEHFAVLASISKAERPEVAVRPVIGFLRVPGLARRRIHHLLKRRMVLTRILRQSAVFFICLLTVPELADRRCAADFRRNALIEVIADVLQDSVRMCSSRIFRAGDRISVCIVNVEDDRSTFFADKIAQRIHLCLCRHNSKVDTAAFWGDPDIALLHKLYHAAGIVSAAVVLTERIHNIPMVNCAIAARPTIMPTGEIQF